MQFFFVHSVVLPDSEDAVSHPDRFHFGKPVEVWCHNLYEPSPHNSFILVSSVKVRAIICTENSSTISGGETVLVAIPLVE